MKQPDLDAAVEAAERLDRADTPLDLAKFKRDIAIVLAAYRWLAIQYAEAEI